jgi:hypothetical protein
MRSSKDRNFSSSSSLFVAASLPYLATGKKKVSNSPFSSSRVMMARAEKAEISRETRTSSPIASFKVRTFQKESNT